MNFEIEANAKLNTPENFQIQHAKNTKCIKILLGIRIKQREVVENEST